MNNYFEAEGIVKKKKIIMRDYRFSFFIANHTTRLPKIQISEI